MWHKDIFERDLSGECVSTKEEEFYKIKEIIESTIKLTHKLNTQDLSPNLHVYFSTKQCLRI
ncbi:hypothetical protein ACRE1S_08165 [Helicobacter himalayensis]|uniref:hypothetical protein n=1 Tax=Helicobacter himalayensis TaxID=1591088 RepID=UPI003D6DD914